MNHLSLSYHNQNSLDRKSPKNTSVWFHNFTWTHSQFKVFSGKMESFMIPYLSTNAFLSLCKDQFPCIDSIKFMSKSPTLTLKLLHFAMKNPTYLEMSKTSKALQPRFILLSLTAKNFALKVFPLIAKNLSKYNLEKLSKSGAFLKFALC